MTKPLMDRDALTMVNGLTTQIQQAASSIRFDALNSIKGDAERWASIQSALADLCLDVKALETLLTQGRAS